MADQNCTDRAPDYEERHRLAVALAEHLDLDLGQITRGSLGIELGTDGRHTVRWQGVAHLTTEELDGILTRIRRPRAVAP